MTYSFDDSPDTMEGFEVSENVESTNASTGESEILIPGQSIPEVTTTMQLQEQAVEENYETALEQVDQRMAIANCFRSMLDNALFDEGVPGAKVAEARIRKFIRGELEILIGMRAPVLAPTSSTQFTNEEVEILRGLIVRLKKPGEVVSSVPRPVQAAPQPKPVRVVANQPNKTSVWSPQTVLRSQPPPQATSLTQRPPSEDSRIPKQYRDDPTARVVNGKVYIQAKNSEGEFLWSKDSKTGKTRAVVRDVTPTARPTGTIQPLSMPSVTQQNMLAEQAAGEQLSSLERMVSLNPVMGQIAGALAISLVPRPDDDDN